MTKPEEKFEQWKQKLLNIGKRNRLINYKETTRSSIKIIEPNFEKVYKSLFNGDTLEFVQRHPSGYEPKNVNTKEKEEELLYFDVKKLKKGQLLTNRIDTEMLKTVGNLRKRAKTALEEQSVNILYAAFGFLHWSETIENKELDIKSPLILVPIEIKLDSLISNYTMKMFDDDAYLNPTLIFKLKHDFNISLPSYDEYDDIGIEKYLDQVKSSISSSGWNVTKEVQIGLFSFLKINMYEDMVNHQEEILTHPIIKAFLGCPSEHFQDSLEGISQTDHDKTVLPIDTYQVLDADSSQLDAILAAKKGSSFVLQGPPGTGKSQTIANIIAENLAQNKKILFVSEKMAALDVVFKRLKENELTDFCLPLHSHKASKREILNELDRTLRIQRVQARDEAILLLDDLQEYKEELNQYSSDLHTPCSKLKKSIYEIYGKLESLKNSPDIVCEIKDVTNTTLKELNQYLHLIQELANSYNGLGITYESNPWLECKVDMVTLDLQQKIKDSMKKIIDSISKSVDITNQMQVSLSTPEVSTFPDLEKLITILVEAGKSTKPLLAWIKKSNLDLLCEEIKELKKKSTKFFTWGKSLNDKYQEDFFKVNPAFVSHDLKSTLSVAKGFLDTSRYPDENAIIMKYSEIVSHIDIVTTYLEKVEKVAINLAKSLNLPIAETILDLQNQTSLLDLIVANPRPSTKWFDQDGIKNCKQIVKKLREECTQIDEIQRLIANDFDSSIFSLDYKNLQNRFQNQYKNFMKFFKSSYHQDKKTLKSFQHNPARKLNDTEIQTVLYRISTVIDKRKWIQQNEDRYESLFGSWFDGEMTDFDGLAQSINVITQILDFFIPNQIPDHIQQILLSNVSHRIDLNLTLIESNKVIKDDRAIASFFITNYTNPFQTNIALMKKTLECSKTLINKGINLFDETSRLAKQPDKVLFPQLIQDLATLQTINEIEEEFAKNHDSLAEKFGHFFNQLSTPWDEIVSTIEWAKKFREIIADQNLGESFIKKICLEDSAIQEARDGAVKLSLFVNQQKKEKNFFESLFDSSVHSLASDSLIDLQNWMQKCLEHLKSLEDWIDYRKNRDKCKKIGLEDFVRVAIEEKTPVNELTHAFLKRFYHIWLTDTIEKFPSINRFRRKRQEDTIGKFKHLDREQLKIARSRIKEILCKKLPNLEGFHSGHDELGLLQREINKRKRNMPVRKLFRSIPSLLLAIKPCLMMSPLSVSLFLDPQFYNFDVVLFDEASQIHTEDGIGAILRGKQLIIAGDSEQLPPSNFFIASTSSGETDIDQDVEDESDSYESILDEAKPIFPEITLRWHYRSKHEHLIAFSNRKIYNQSLTTFPSSIEKKKGHGVEYIYLPGGVYDRSGKRDNPVEAAKIADLVAEHINQFPLRSLGVVTFSEAQQQTIESHIKTLQLKHQDDPFYIDFFSENKEEPFFIKNIENVQGDERDVIFFSIGYAKDQNGTMHMNFGPLSNEGGKRRLNVAITRAKYNVKLVGSIQPEDIDVDRTSSEGAHLLREYINYAKKGPDAFLYETSHSETINTESPFEEDIYDILVKEGFQVVTQVGCSGYRLDMAIKHPKISGVYVLGIECDGATYHRSRIARERDRLRQQVLEGRGWKIYRIWSTDWVKDRKLEKNHLLKAVKNAIDNYQEEEVFVQSITDTTKYSNNYESEITCETTNNFSFDPYIEFDMSKVKYLEKYQNDRTTYIREIAALIIHEEGPIHIDLMCQKIIPLLNKQKVTTTLKLEIKKIIDKLPFSFSLTEYLDHYGDFYWIRGRKNTKTRIPGVSGFIRPIEYIMLDEIEDAVLKVINKNYGINESGILTETARLFGFNRTGEKIREYIDSAINSLLSKKEIGIVDGKYAIKELDKEMKES